MSYRFDVAIHLSKENFDKIIKHEVASKYLHSFKVTFYPDDTVTFHLDWATSYSLSYYELGVVRHALIDVPHIFVYIGDDINDNTYEEVLIDNNEYLYDYAPSIERTLKI